MEQIIEWEYFRHLRHNVNLYGNFYVALYHSYDVVPDFAENRRICHSVLSPLGEMADAVFLYGTFADKDLGKLSGGNYLRKRGKIQILENDASFYFELLGAGKLDDTRGSLLFHLKMDEHILSDVFSKSYDPIVLSGMGSVCSKSAIKYAKSKITDTDFFAILSQAGPGIGSLFFLANAPIFLKLTELAATHCSARQGFVNCYGPGVKLPPLEDKASYGTGFPE